LLSEKAFFNELKELVEKIYHGDVQELESTIQWQGQRAAHLIQSKPQRPLSC
jgi:predicted ribosome quality control (RQC) complex YloA/Tae2 family protein